MKTYYSPSKNGFYAEFLRDSYEAAGTWPDDAFEVTERWRDYLVAAQGKGKIISPNEYGQPMLRDQPPPTAEELIALAEDKKSALLSKAAEVIAPLQDAADLDEATSKEIADLKVWKKYRILVNRVDVTNPEWPEEPQ
ncbi:TPA: tail fiber assembly protein [Enterobacter asburiae]|nr:tail fiber assembly protein [Enterobacter asburiae]HDR2800465.1 tail fiber assembly protein [Enterobacter asburiae]